MSLFSREASCDGCGISFSKKSLHGFDPTWRRERSTDDQRRRLCGACLISVFREYLREYPFRAMVVGPVEGHSAFFFAPLDKSRRRYWNWSDELRDQVRDLLPPEGAACRRCGAAASFNWCGVELFARGLDALVIAERGSFPEEPRCAKCVADSVEPAFRRPDFALDEVFPPADADGALLPGDS